MTVNGASTDGSSATNTSGSYTISGLAQYTETQSPTQSGLLSSSLVRDQTALNADGTGTCGTTWTGATTISANRTENSGTGIASGNCYRYTLKGVDNVGNTASIQIIVKVDTTAPSTPSLTLSKTGNFAFTTGTTAYYNGNTGTSSSITVSATTSDAESGIQKVTFPTLASGFSGGGAVNNPGPYSATYTWTSSSDSGSKTVIATNGIGNTASSTFSLVDDTTAPTGGALTPSGTVDAIGTTSYSTTGTYTISRTDYAEAQTASASGLASSTLVRTQATLNTDGTCGSFGSPTTVTGNLSESSLAQGCYSYTLTGTDNVGNSQSTSATVIVDKTAPTISSLQLANGGTTQGQIEASDTIAVTFSEQMRVSSICSGGAANWSGDTSSQTIGGNGNVTVTINDNAGGSGNDTVTLSVAGSQCTTFQFGTIDLGSNAYVSGGNATFSGSGANASTIAWDPTTHTMTITLGTKGGTGTVATVASSTAILTPSSSITDSAGNAVTGTGSTGPVKNF